MLLFLIFIGDFLLTIFLLLVDLTELIDCLLAVFRMQGILSKLFLAEFRGRFLAVDLRPFYEERPETDLCRLRLSKKGWRFFEPPDFCD